MTSQLIIFKEFQTFKLNENLQWQVMQESLFSYFNYKDVKILNESLELADRSKDVSNY
jgi:hypothetical protein